MNREIIHHQLSELLEAIREQYDTICNAEGRIPQIELDILMDNTRKLYDQLNLLQKLNTASPSLQPGHAPTLPVQPDPPFLSPPPPPGIKPAERPKSAIRKEEEAKNRVQKAADPDLFASEVPTFSMKLREAREQTLPPKTEPVEHLKQLISINDKFTFINELFDGSLKEYNEAIETLNGFRMKNDAFGYLDLLRKKNLWELESGTLMKLKEIVERYYP